MSDHEQLIDLLSRQASPVRRLAPPWRRALGWLLLALPCGVLAALLLQRAGTNWAQAGALWAALHVSISLALGVLAIMTAFRHSIAGLRPVSGKWSAWLALAWLATAVAGLSQSPEPVGQSGEGLHCYVFMLSAGAPMVALVVLALRRSRALYPVRCLAWAGLGVAALTLTLLGFCHPVTMHLLDLSMHLVGAATLIGATVVMGRRWVAIS